GEALKIAYRTGTITGMLTDGLGLLGGTLIFMIYGVKAYEVLVGFGFGGTLLALFMRVGGGIYTKAADVGADLVGKVEKGIPEDDPRNARVIADLVGDNVGDCAGMAADIFESYEVTMVSAMILGLVAFGPKGVIFPLIVRAIGVGSSIIGTYAVRARGEMRHAMRAISRGFTLSAIVSIAGFAVLAYVYMGEWAPYVFAATFAGILLAISINFLTEYFTSKRKPPVQEIARAAQTGAGTNLLSGLAVGYESTVWSILIIAAAIVASVAIFGGDAIKASYGIALCGIGMLTLTGNNVSMDAFGPISDNAGGIAEMAGVEGGALEVLADLDSVGNTTKAITKGVAIGSAVVAALSLFNAFVEEAKLSQITITDPYVFVGLLIGGAVPFLFSSIAIRAVGRAASAIIKEVRRQFASIKGLWEGTADPDYAACVNICTAAAQKELVGIAVLAILSPIVVGFLLDRQGLGGFLAGAILVGQLLAVFMATSGGAWDNAKKSIEDGIYGGKGSDAHKAAVTGDTVGDPLKDTAGPAINPLLKVINLVALLVAPLIAKYHGDPLTYALVLPMIVAIGAAVWFSKKERATW
ncbi:MAG: sodium-translocating pyrophosphatase, partial [Candidatus Bathyarchaeia archaeon]